MLFKLFPITQKYSIWWRFDYWIVFQTFNTPNKKWKFKLRVMKLLPLNYPLFVWMLYHYIKMWHPWLGKFMTSVQTQSRSCIYLVNMPLFFITIMIMTIWSIIVLSKWLDDYIDSIWLFYINWKNIRGVKAHYNGQKLLSQILFF